MKRLILPLVLLGVLCVAASTASAGPWLRRHRVLYGPHVVHRPIVAAPVVVAPRVFYRPYVAPYYVPQVRYYTPGYGAFYYGGPGVSVRVGW
jgi:hypothetical protein